MRPWVTFGVRAPERGAPPAEARRFIRAMQLRTIAAAVAVLVVLVALRFPSWMLVGVGLSVLALLASIVTLTLAIRRDERSE
jgi:hypothetical protein